LDPALKFTNPDLAFDVHGPGKGGLYTLVGGMKVADGAALDKSLHEIIKDLPEKERDQIKLDVEKMGDVSIHRMEPKDRDEGFRKTFGEGPAFFAMRSDVVFLALGDNALDALKGALKVAPKEVQPLEFEVAAARIADLMAKDKPEAPKAAAKAFGQDKGADKIRLTLAAGNELKLRFVMKTPVLKFFHLMEPDAQK